MNTNTVRATALALAAGFVLPGCGLELLGATAVRSPLEAENAEQTTHTLEKVRGPAITGADNDNVAALQQAVQRYAQAHKAYPPRLDSLKPAFLMRVPETESGEAFAYDPRTGQVWHPRQPPPAQGGAANSQTPAQRIGGLGGSAGAAKQKRDQTYGRMLDELGS